MWSHVLTGGTVMAAGVLLCAAAAAGPSRLRPLAKLRVRLKAKGAVVVAPGSKQYQAIAQALGEGLAEHTGHAPRIADDSVGPDALGPGPILVLGNLMDSTLARALYLQGYDFTDYAWPGPGGHVVRTVRDPVGSGAHVVMLGGSDADGAAAAAKELLAIVKQAGPELGYVNKVMLGKWASQIRSYTSELLGKNDKVWHRSGVSGSWDYQIQIAKAGIGYLRTGDEAYLPVFKRELRYWLDHDARHPKGDAPQMLHGFLNQLIIAWDLVRDHPCFSAAERRKFDDDFLYVFRSREGPGRIDSASRRQIIRDNHGTRTALDGFFGGRYFLRRFGLEEGKRWLAIADRYFAVQMGSAKPVEDSWGHQWHASLYNTLVYAMAAGKTDYFGSQPLKLAADRALIAHLNGGAPFGYLSACAVATGDTGYLSGWRGGERLGKRGAAMAGHGDEYLRCFCTGARIRSRKDLVGVAAAPVDPLWFKSIDTAGFNPGGLFVVTAKREACFDKVAIREGWQADDYYLLFDGISGGHHSYQDGNCIVRLVEGGVSWLGGGRDAKGSATVRSHNGVFVALDGAGPGRLHRYARRLVAGEAGHCLAVGGALEGVGDVDWQRYVVRKRGCWTLVIDRAVARKAGEVLAERHWHIRGQVTARPDGLVSVQSRAGKTSCLHLQSAGLDAGGMSGTSHRIEIVRAKASPGAPFELATLLYVNDSPDKHGLRLTKTKAGWRVDARQGAEFVRAGDPIVVLTTKGVTTIGGAPPPSVPTYAEALKAKPVPAGTTLPLRPRCGALELPWRQARVGEHPLTAVAVAPDGRVAAGDAKGNAVVLAPTGGKLSVAKLPSRVLSLHFVGEDLMVGEERGALTRLAPDGTQRWQVVIPYVPMAWPYWSEQKSRVREITSADINGDGEPEILIANSDRRVYAFRADGKELWKASVQWGVYTAMAVGQRGGKLALHGGTSQPSMHGWCILYGADGRLVGHYSRSDLTSWSIPCQFRDLRLADLDGDGQPEAVNAIDTNCRQLVAYRQNGKILWDADVAGAAEALAVRKGEDGAAIVYCASQAGYVFAFDGRTGARRWACFIGEAASFVAPYGSRQVVAVARSGRVFVLDGKGGIAGCQDLGRPVSALLRPGGHRAGNAIVVGTRDGTVWVLDKPR